MRPKPEKPLHYARPDLEPDDGVPAEKAAIEGKMSGRGSQSEKRWWRPKPKQSAKKVFLDHKDLIERVAKSAARRARFPKEDVEDFHSSVNLKLIEGDYAILRKHRGESSIPTFLTVVINNQLRDFRNHKYGKFRHSAKAERLGATAKALELLIVRDRHDAEPAIEMLKRQQPVAETHEELLELVEQLRRRTPHRRFVGEEALEQPQYALPQSGTEQNVVDGERAATSQEVTRVLNIALKALSPQDLLILKMHYRDGCPISTIAAHLKLEQRPLYSRRVKCLATLKRTLEAEGLTWDVVRETLGWHGEDLQADFGGDNTEQTNNPLDDDTADEDTAKTEAPQDGQGETDETGPSN